MVTKKDLEVEIAWTERVWEAINKTFEETLAWAHHDLHRAKDSLNEEMQRAAMLEVFLVEDYAPPAEQQEPDEVAYATQDKEPQKPVASQTLEGGSLMTQETTTSSGRNLWQWLALGIFVVIGALILSSLWFGEPVDWNNWRNSDQASVDQSIDDSANNNDQAVIDDLKLRLAMLEDNINPQVITTAIGDVDSSVAQCPSVGEASMLIAHNEGALVREGGRNSGEEACLFEWRDDLAPSDTIWCPDGWACELDTVGPNGYYYFGGGGSYEIDAGSFRLIAAYPDGDPIHSPCAALANSRDFLAFSGEPAASWKLYPGNFSCEGEDTGVPPAAVDNGSQPDNTGNTCPAKDQAQLVANKVGGYANEWHRLNEGQWKRASDSTGATLDTPWGTLNVWNGSKTINTHKGQSAFGYEATWNCGK